MQGVKIAMHSTHHLDRRESKQTFLLISPGCPNTAQRHLAIYGRCRCVGSRCRGEIAPVRCLCRSRSGWAHVHRLDPKNDGTYMWQCAPNLRRCCTPTQRMMAGGKKTGGYPISLHTELMARCVRTPCMLRDVLRCGIIPCWLPMRYLALFTVNAAAGCGGAPVCACMCMCVCVCLCNAKI